MPKILIVDDEPVERNGLMMLFTMYFQDYAIKYDPIVLMEAENGADALVQVEENEPDIIITDIRMPIMDGITLISKAKELLPNLVTIIISAYGEFEYAQAAIECNVSHYILKPVVPEEFTRVVEGALEKVTEKSRMAYEAKKEEKIKKELTSYDMELRKTSADKVIKKVLEILENEYKEDLSVDALAERVYLSNSYLSYIFKKYTGKTIMKYITDLKLDKAKEILTNGTMKIADVAAEVGYRDISYFCSQFKSKFGMTPTQFRNISELE